MCCVSPGVQVLAGTAEKMKNFAVIYLVGLFPLLFCDAEQAGAGGGSQGWEVCGLQRLLPLAARGTLRTGRTPAGAGSGGLVLRAG